MLNRRNRQETHPQPIEGAVTVITGMGSIQSEQSKPETVIGIVKEKGKKQVEEAESTFALISIIKAIVSTRPDPRHLEKQMAKLASQTTCSISINSIQRRCKGPKG